MQREGKGEKKFRRRNKEKSALERECSLRRKYSSVLEFCLLIRGWGNKFDRNCERTSLFYLSITDLQNYKLIRRDAILIFNYRSPSKIASQHVEVLRVLVLEFTNRKERPRIFQVSSIYHK